MQKLFIKWFEVPGEPNAGDYLLHTFSGSLSKITKVFPNEIHYEDGMATRNSPFYRIGRLFVCSRDIAVGDLASYKYDIGHPYKNGKDEFIADQSHVDHNKGIYQPHYGKRIAEVSLKAKWVKPEQDYDEDQIRYGYYEGERFKIPPMLRIEFIDKCNFSPEERKRFKKLAQFKCDNCDAWH